MVQKLLNLLLLLQRPRLLVCAQLDELLVSLHEPICFHQAEDLDQGWQHVLYIGT